MFGSCAGRFNPTMTKVKEIPAAKVEVTRDGPYLVSGGLPLQTEVIGTDREGDSVTWKPGAKFPAKASYALCRCGPSAS